MTEKMKTARIAIWSLVLGILGLTCIGPIGAIPAIICGHVGLSKIKRAAGSLTGQGMAIAGLVLGYVGLVVSLFILPALLFPAIMHARSTAMEAKARVEVQSIQYALKAYFVEYGNLPDGKGNSEIIAALTGANPRGILFLDVAKSSQRDGAYVDPWSEPYAIKLDSNHDNSITVGSQTVQGPCAVWSYGPNRQDEKGMGDDIASWR